MVTSGFLQGQTDQGSGLTTETIDLATFKSKDPKCLSSLPDWDKQISGATGGLLPNNQPIVCGGYQPGIYKNECYTIRYNGVRFEWFKKVQMSHHRVWAASVVLGNGLWVTGGISTDEGTSTSTEIVSISDSQPKNFKFEQPPFRLTSKQKYQDLDLAYQ